MPTAGDSGLDVPALTLLWAARETGLLDALLTETGSAGEAADIAGVTDRAARVTVDALVDLGFFYRTDGAVEPTNRALGLLATRDIRSIGRVPAELDQFAALASLPAAMRADEQAARDQSADEQPGRPQRDRQQRIRHRLGADYAVDAPTVQATVDGILAANPGADQVLALADGPGRHACELAERGPAVTLLDGHEVIDAVDPLLAGSGVEPVARSLMEIDPASFDLVFLVDGMWPSAPAENRFTLRAVERALAPGGAFVAAEPLRGRSDAMPAVAAKALATGLGEPYTEATIAGWCAAAGLGEVEASDVPGTPYQAIVAERHSED
ncbi:MAG: class I SAM-dependent methyltransferase [Halolamina sp.]|uniref:class I SAM-dependent methyltransferase n=1 Tax=Halolamina sp. TaxID=1940283 RepID=UPI002FC37E19